MAPPPGFDWDSVKREINLKEHRIDFRDAPQIFNGPHLIWSSSREGEHRLLAIGFLEGREVTAV
ncbi:MAG: BrnT family toxin, partial [Xanthobacteraceae bacterium]